MQAPIPAAEETVVSTNMETETMREKRHLNSIHSYVCNSKNNGECDSGHETPIKTSTSKKKPRLSVDNEPQLSLLEVQDNIIRVLNAKTEEINCNVNDIKELVKQNTMEIEGLKKSVDHCFLEVADLKKDNATLLSRCQTQENKMQRMENKVNEIDAYSRRMNLKLYGIHESPGEDIRSKVITTLLVVLPDKNRVEAAVDVVYRLGRHKDINGGNTTRPRPVIIKFSKQDTRDAIWSASRSNEHLKAHRVWFKQDLTAVDKEKRERLWPIVDKARKEGKVAYFVGARAFVDKKEVFSD